MKTLPSFALCAALLAATGLAEAKPRFNIKIDGKDPVEGPVRVAKGEVRDGDIVARGSITVEGVLNGDSVTLDGSIAVPGSVNGDVVSLGSAVSVAGTVSGDVASLGGDVTVDGRVHGDIASMGGDVVLGPKAEVNGSVALLGGKLKKADSAKLNGSVTQHDLGMSKDLLRLAGRVSRKTVDPEVRETWRLARVVAGLVFLAGCALLVALTAAFAPKHVETVAAAVEGDFWRSAGIGLLVLIATGPALLLVAVSIIGLPLVPVGLLAVFAAKLLSVAAFSLVLARRFAQSTSRPAPSVLGGAALGFLLLMSPNILGKLIALTGLPGGIGGILLLANLILLSFAVMVGVGAIWTTRFGTRGA